MTGTLRWNHIISDELFSNHTLTYSNYEYMQQQEMDVRDFEWKAGMGELTYKADFDHYKGKHHLTYLSLTVRFLSSRTPTLTLSLVQVV